MTRWWLGDSDRGTPGSAYTLHIVLGHSRPAHGSIAGTEWGRLQRKDCTASAGDIGVVRVSRELKVAMHTHICGSERNKISTLAGKRESKYVEI